MIICLLNQKGGVGKTTSAVNLAVALAEMGWSVLLDDVDPQGSADSFVDISSTVATVSAMPPGAATSAFGARYDYIILDCPPTRDPGSTSAQALAVAHLAIVPTPPNFLDLRGLAQLMETAQEVRKESNPGLLLRVLITRRPARDSEADAFEIKLRAAFPDAVCAPTIPESVVFKRAATAHKSVLQHRPHSPGAEAYRQLAAEIAALAPEVAEWHRITRNAEAGTRKIETATLNGHSKTRTRVATRTTTGGRARAKAATR